jgi:hypothetical protein
MFNNVQSNTTFFARIVLFVVRVLTSLVNVDVKTGEFRVVRLRMPVRGFVTVFGSSRCFILTADQIRGIGKAKHGEEPKVGPHREEKW